MNYGSTFKALRKNKKLSQEKVAHGICSRTTLASFESDGTRVSLKNILMLLDKINVQIDEFLIYANGNDTQLKKIIAKKIMDSINSKDHTAINSLITELDSYYSSTSDYFYLLNKAQLLILLDKFSIADFPKQTIKHHSELIANHLIKIETWGKTEFSLFNNLMFNFSSDLILNFLQYPGKKLHLIQNLPQMEDSLLTLYLNATTLFITRNEIDYAKKIKIKTHELTHIKKYNLYHDLLNTFQLNLISYIETSNLEFLAKNEKILSLLDEVQNKDVYTEFKLLQNKISTQISSTN